MLIGDISIDTVQSRSRRFREDENGKFVEERNDAEKPTEPKEPGDGIVEWAIGGVSLLPCRLRRALNTR